MSHTTTANDPPPPCPFDIGVLADRLANAGRSAHTVRAYQRAWRKLQAWCAAEKTTPLTLDRNSAAKAYDFLANGTATASRVQFLAAIRYAYQEWNSPNPFAALDKPKHDISRTPPCYLTAEQAARLLGTLESHKDKGYFHGLCYQLATFLLFTATRFHEPTQLTWDDVIRKNSVPIAIHLIGKGGKAVDVPLVGKLGAQLETVQVQNPRLANLLSSYAPENTPTTITEETLTVLACIAFKQPITQIEIDRIFDREMRYYVNKLRGMDLVNERIGPDSRLHFVTTAEFLRRFNIQSPTDLHALLQTQAAP